MNHSRLLFLLPVFAWAISCGGSDFSAAPNDKQPDASTGGSDAGRDASGSGGTAGTDAGAGGTALGGHAGTDSGSGGATGGTAGEGGSGAGGGTAGDAGAGGDGGTAGTGGSGGTSGAGGTGGVADSGPDCATGQTCLEGIPTGWTPMAVGTSTPPGCVGTIYTLHSQSDLNAAQSYACPCSCTAPMSSVCTSRLEYLSDAACSDTAVAPLSLLVACNKSTTVATNASYLRFSSTMASACASPVKPAIPDVSSSAFACIAYDSNAPTECGSGGLCINQVPTPAKVCLMHAGAHSCPTGFSASSFYYEGVSDTRVCAGTCTCQGSCLCNDAACHAQLHGDMACTGAPTDVTAGACVPKPLTYGMEFSVTLSTAPTGSCKPSGSWYSSGSVTGTLPVTICCPP